MQSLLVDAGGTHLRIAIDNGGDPIDIHVYQVNASQSFTEALQAFCAEQTVTPKVAAISVAGPVQEDLVHFTNRDWVFSQSELKARLGLDHLFVMNDFAALATGLPHLKEKDVRVISSGQDVQRGAMAVLGPGTGLGVAVAVPHEGEWLAVPGEGGHVAASLDGLVSADVQQALWAGGWLPWEEVLSGRGLLRLHGALHSTVLPEFPEAITSQARAGDELAQETLSIFAALLGRRASDAALQYGAWGGVFLAGGIVPQLADIFDWPVFLEAFENKGVYRDLVKRIPVKLITRSEPAFVGLAHIARRMSRD